MRPSSKPIVGYLDPFFFQVNEEVRTGLQQVFDTTNEFTLAISGTGSAGMEAAVSNFVDPGTKFLVFSAGYFAERIAEMGRRHGADLVRCEKPWGEVFTEDEAREAIQREKPQLVAFVHAETSTGALQIPLAITKPAHEAGALVIADCVTSLGAAPIHLDASGIDMAFSCTQKGLSCPPGLSPFSIGPRAEERLKARKTPNSVWYLDLKLLSEYYGTQRRYHHTAPVSNFYALREGLATILDEGVEQRFERHARMHANSSAASRPWGCRCTWPIRPIAFPISTPSGCRRASTTRRCAGRCWPSTASKSPADSARWPGRSSASA